MYIMCICIHTYTYMYIYTHTYTQFIPVSRRAGMTRSVKSPLAGWSPSRLPACLPVCPLLDDRCAASLHGQVPLIANSEPPKLMLFI